MVTPEISPRLLGDAHSDPLLAEVAEVGETLDARARQMFEALSVLYREGILEEPTIRAMRKQKEQDGKRLLERYKHLLGRLKQRGPLGQEIFDAATGEGQHLAPEQVARVIDAILIRVDFTERAYLHEKQLLKISTDHAALLEEIKHLEAIAHNYRGSSVAYSAEEKLTELRKQELSLARDERRARMERQVMEMETGLLVAETVLDNLQGEARLASEREIKLQETQLHRVLEELGQLPVRSPTRRAKKTWE